MNGQEWAISVDGRLSIVLQPPVRGVTDLWAVNAYERDGRLTPGKAATFTDEAEARAYARALWDPVRYGQVSHE